MRRAFLLSALVALACGSTNGGSGGDDASSSGGSGSESSTSDGGSSTGGRDTSSSSGSSSSGGDGGSDVGGSGGTTSGGTGGTGGTETGGTGSSDTGGTGGTTTELDPCDPPAITWPPGIGVDQNNLCGWTDYNDPSIPSGYTSISIDVDCSSPAGRIDLQLTNESGVRYNPWVEIIDTADRCTTGTMAGVDRKFTFASGYCVKISSPFEGLTFGGLAANGGCGVGTAPGSISVNLGEPGWVKVEAAALVSSACPLSCP